MFQIATTVLVRVLKLKSANGGHTETFNTTEKASHNMLEIHVNSHCNINITIIGYFYQLDVELMLHARTMITLH